jgi:LmbE family N-acetylglucosaminyl deacetylase
MAFVPHALRPVKFPVSAADVRLRTDAEAANHRMTAAARGNAGRSVVAVVAHPDDEVLIAGGTLALAAVVGTPTGVVSLTRGERGPVAPGSLRRGELLAEARARELGDAAGALGVSWTRCLSYPDGALEREDVVAIGEELTWLLDAHDPAVLLTFGPDGLYGHPDHLATRCAALAAAGMLASRPSVLESVWAPELVAQLAAAAGDRGLPGGLWDLRPEMFGATRDAADEIVTVDVRDVLDRKLRALACHRTQFAADHLLAALPHDLATRFLGHETWAGAGRSLDGLLGRQRSDGALA